MNVIVPVILCLFVCVFICVLYNYRQKQLSQNLYALKQELNEVQKQAQQKKKDLYSYKKELNGITGQIEKQRKTLSVEQENFGKQKEFFEKELKRRKELIAAEADKEREVQVQLTRQTLVELNGEIEAEASRLKKIRDALSASAAAQLREREKEENQQFYMLNIPRTSIEDIDFLNSIKSRLHDPVILSKLIWTQYYQKELKLLCSRVLQKEKITGIYKITNTKTQEAYIGQSVDIVKRWTDHIKCGLGINASATNKLYNAMKQYGVHNFTFELMEECKKEELNEKEAFWIGMYQTNTLGYNITAGNKK